MTKGHIQTEISKGQSDNTKTPPKGSITLCSIHLEANLVGSRNEGVPTNNERGRGSGACFLCRGLNKSRNIVPTSLFVRVQCFRKDLYKTVEGPGLVLWHQCPCEDMLQMFLLSDTMKFHQKCSAYLFSDSCLISTSYWHYVTYTSDLF